MLRGIYHPHFPHIVSHLNALLGEVLHEALSLLLLLVVLLGCAEPARTLLIHLGSRGNAICVNNGSVGNMYLNVRGHEHSLPRFQWPHFRETGASVGCGKVWSSPMAM